MLNLNKIYLGDCLEVMKDIEDGSVNMILCDLPYAFKGKNRVTANLWDLPIDNDLLWSHYLRIIKEDGAIVLTATNPFASYLIMKNLKYFKYEWVWEKDNGSNFVHTKYQPMRVHELVLVFGKSPTTYNKSNKNMKYNAQFTQGKPYFVKRDMSNMNNLDGFKGRTDTHNKEGKRQPRTVQKINVERGLHPSQKPVTLMEYLIKTYTNENEIVLDNCCGSGSTLVACINTNRQFIGIEKDEKYYEIAKDRIKNFSRKI
jgi:DNA modification methylase